jgi:MFS family permease
MVLTQVVIVAMTMTPIHMRDHHYGLAATGLVIAVHIGAMYLPSPVTGRLPDRYGARPVLAAGGLALLAAAMTGHPRTRVAVSWPSTRGHALAARLTITAEQSFGVLSARPGARREVAGAAV